MISTNERATSACPAAEITNTNQTKKQPIIESHLTNIDKHRPASQSESMSRIINE